jgi:hypothetical protein
VDHERQGCCENTHDFESSAAVYIHGFTSLLARLFLRSWPRFATLLSRATAPESSLNTNINRNPKHIRDQIHTHPTSSTPPQRQRESHSQAYSRSTTHPPHKLDPSQTKTT